MVAHKKYGTRAYKATLKLPLIIAAVALLAFAATSASAEVYKCTDANSKTSYSDIPCSSGSVQDITNTSPSLGSDSDSTQHVESAITRQMDAAVKAAIASDDYIRAEALATTQQQRDWITSARKEYEKRTVTSQTTTDTYADKSNSAECLQARRDLEREASGISHAETLNAKTSLMQAACGLQSSPEYIYGGHILPVYYRGHYYKPPVNNGYTSPPYDRTMAQPFGSRFIRPEDAPK